MAAIGEIVPVLPVPLVASVFMHDPRRSMSELELKAAVLALIERVEALGAHVYVSRTDRDYASTVGLCMLTLRHLAREHDGLFTGESRRVEGPGALRELDRAPGTDADRHTTREQGPTGAL